MAWSTAVASGVRQTAILYNGGSPSYAKTTTTGTATDAIGNAGSATILLNAGDTISIQIYQDSGATLPYANSSIQIAILNSPTIASSAIPYQQPELSYTMTVAVDRVGSATPCTIYFANQYNSQGSTGLAYSQSTGAFTNSTSQAITICIAYTLIWGGGTGNSRTAYLLHSSGTRYGSTYAAAIGDTAGVSNNSTAIVVMNPGESFTLVGYQDSGAGIAIVGAQIQISTLNSSLLVASSTIASNLYVGSNVSPTSTGYPTDRTGTTGNIVTSGNISAGNVGVFRNRIINGDMRISQRFGGTAVVTPNQLYTLDRWTTMNGGFPCTVQQVAVPATHPAGITTCLCVKLTATTASPGSNIFVVNQGIEGNNVSDINWGTSMAQPGRRDRRLLNRGGGDTACAE